MAKIVALVLLTAVTGAFGETATMAIGVYDPTGQSPRQIEWAPYPADPPSGFHWQETGSPAVKIDPVTGRPLPGQFTGGWILVRDGYMMPKIRAGSGSGSQR